MTSTYRAQIAKRLRGAFEKEYGGTVIWNVACWAAVKEVAQHAIVRPFSTEDKAAWAKGVLEKEYPGRTYVLYKERTRRPIENEVLEQFESMTCDEIFRMELGHKIGLSEE